MVYNYENDFVDFKFKVPSFKMNETDAIHLILTRKKITIRKLAEALKISHTVLYKKVKTSPKEILEEIEKTCLQK
jgi:hypothetical protein